MGQPWLYIVLLGLVVVVYARFIPKQRSAGTSQSNVVKEIEQTMEQFSAELEEENKQLLELVSTMKKEHEVQSAKLIGRIEALEQQNRSVGERLTVLLQAEERRKESLPSASADPARPSSTPEGAFVVPERASAPQSEQENGMMNIRERYTSVFKLYDQGKSTEYIAKKLDMNKGEVMLIIQLGMQEDKSRA